MSKEPEYCQLCLAEKVIATVGGPTCRHGNFDWDELFNKLEEAKEGEPNETTDQG